MTTMPTEDQLRVPQPESALSINRERLRLLNDIVSRRARRSESGRDVLKAPVDRHHPTRPGVAGNPPRGGYGSMLGGKVRELWAAGLAVLTDDGHYELTAAGETARVQAAAGYAAARVTAGK